MNSALPEVAESEATGQVAEIYADIRQSLKLNNVNLIYRYFATIDGALPWAWNILKPHFRSGELKRYARRSRELYTINFPLKEKLLRPSLTAIENGNITAVLDFYLTANPMNLFALQILNNHLSRHNIDHASRITPLVGLHTLRHAAESHQFSSVARELMFYVSQGVEQIRPTLLRQLAQWPHFVDSIASSVKEICCDSNFEEQTKSILDYSLSELNHLQPVEEITDLQAKPLRELSEFCQYFPTPLIRMTIIANHLRGKL